MRQVLSRLGLVVGLVIVGSLSHAGPREAKDDVVDVPLAITDAGRFALTIRWRPSSTALYRWHLQGGVNEPLPLPSEVSGRGNLRIVLSPGARWAASIIGSDRFVVWELDHPRKARTVTEEDETFSIRSVFVQAGGTYALAIDGKRMRLYDAAKGKRLHNLTGGSDILRACVSPDGGRVAAGTVEGEVLVWDLKTGGLTHHFAGPDIPVESLVFDGKGDRLLALRAAENTGTVKVEGDLALYSLTTKKAIWRLPTKPTASPAASFTSDEKRVALIEPDYLRGGSVSFYDPTTAKRVRQLAIRARFISTQVFCPDFRVALTSSSSTEGKFLTLWDVESWEERHTLVGPPPKGFDADQVFLSPDAKEALSVSGDSFVLWSVPTRKATRIYSPEPGKPTQDTRHNLKSPFDYLCLVRGLAVDWKHRRAATCDGKGVLRLWDLDSDKALRAVDVKSGAADRDWMPTGVAFSPNGDTVYVVVGGRPAGARLTAWSFATGRQSTGTGKVTDVWSIVQTFPGRDHLLLRGRGVLCRWDVPARKPVWREAVEKLRQLPCAAVSQRSERILSGGNGLSLLDGRTGKVLMNLLKSNKAEAPGLPQPRITAIAFTEGDKLAVCGDAQGRLTVWDVSKGRTIRTLLGTGVRTPILAIAASEDGKTVLTGSEGGTIKLWDLTKPREVASLRLKPAPLKAPLSPVKQPRK